MTLEYRSGFPRDDELSLQQWAGLPGQGSLDIFYDSQFVQNEVSIIDRGGGVVSEYAPTEHTPILPGTMTGMLYHGDTAIQTFVVSSNGLFAFTAIGNPRIYAEETRSRLNLATGELFIGWNEPPGANHVVISYEFSTESMEPHFGYYKQPRQRRRVSWNRYGF